MHGDRSYAAVVTFAYWMFCIQNLPDHLSGMNGSIDAVNFTAPSLFNRTTKIALLAIGILFTFMRPRLARAYVSQINGGALAFLVIAIGSVAWSISADSTVLRFISLLSTMALCYSAGMAGWHARRFQELVVPPLILLLVASLAMGIVAPDLAIERGTDLSQLDAWHGISHSKNEFGMLASIATIFYVQRLLVGEAGKLAGLAGVAVSFTCLLLSRSNTSLFACLVACTGMFFLLRSRLVMRRYTSHFVIGVVVLIVVYELAIQHIIPGVDVLLAPILNLTGKDSTFSARTIIWQIIKEHIQYSPWIGTGFGAYWIGPVASSPSSVFLTSILALYPTESHNGYLEVVNDLGYLGLGVLSLFLVLHIRQCLQLMAIDRPQATLVAGLLFHQMIMNMSESDWFSLTGTWAIIAMSSFMASRALLDARQRGLVPARARHVRRAALRSVAGQPPGQ